MPGITDEHNRVLPQPVFPTPLYEIIVCSLLFLFLWGIRKRVRTPYIIFGLYLFLNGLERFLLETIRVNKLYTLFGVQLSQAQIIAICLMLGGLLIVALAKRNSARLT